MQDDSDIIPERKKYLGRRVHSMEDPMARGTVGHAPKCFECPKWHDGTSVCLIRGAHQARMSPACMYGITIIRAKRKADKRDRIKAGTCTGKA